MEISTNISAKRITYIRAGGIIQKVIHIASDSDAVDVINHFKNFNTIGAGSNTIVQDGGVRSAIPVISLSGNLKCIEQLSKNSVICGAGVRNMELIRKCTELGIGGFEFITGIPGSIGGGIKMNSGCNGYDFAHILEWADVIQSNGKIYRMSKDELNLNYRNSGVLDSWIILRAKLVGHQASCNDIKAQLQRIRQYRLNHQPTGIPTSGSTFKNPKNNSAWRLLDQAGLRGYAHGCASFDAKHCNFITHNGKGLANDIVDLCYIGRKKVLDATGILIELEVKIIGDR